MLLETDNSGVLPSAQYIDPNQKSAWRQTREAMMPGVKTKRQRAGDPSYGAGASSGSKVPKTKKNKAASTKYVFG
jgi:hypothetical protein